MIQLGNCLADITFEILLLQSSLEPGLVMEFPEDLGGLFSVDLGQVQGQPVCGSGRNSNSCWHNQV